jgi:transposase-like protein
LTIVRVAQGPLSMTAFPDPPLFPPKDECLRRLVNVRWGGIPRCPYCPSIRVSKVLQGNRYHCNKCSTSFSATVNTVFHGSHLPLCKWFLAIHLLVDSQGRTTVRELASVLCVNKNTAMGVKRKLIKELKVPGQRNMLLALVFPEWQEVQD